MDENQIVKEFNQEIDQAFLKAMHSEKGGDENWYGFINTYGVTPLSKENKEFLLNSEMKIVRGAFPIELRGVFEKIIGKYSVLVSSSPLLAGAIQKFDMEGKVKEYYQKIKPFTGLGDIFKNATTGTQKYSSGMQAAKTNTKTCKNCGAPRLEEMQYDSCLFCGSKLFEAKGL
jgi:hypothetical protein